MTCPICQSEMVKRQNRETEETFWGCTRYPECRGTRPISEYEKMIDAGAPTLFDIKDVT
jgi:ssDNA-binding Zn-finger/Zn-ribbon topoisomerase 1